MELRSYSTFWQPSDAFALHGEIWLSITCAKQLYSSRQNLANGLILISRTCTFWTKRHFIHFPQAFASFLPDAMAPVDGSNLRFAVGDRVSCNMGSDGWASGKVVALHYREANWQSI